MLLGKSLGTSKTRAVSATTCSAVCMHACRDASSHVCLYKALNLQNLFNCKNENEPSDRGRFINQNCKRPGRDTRCVIVGSLSRSFPRKNPNRVLHTCLTTFEKMFKLIPTITSKTKCGWYTSSFGSQTGVPWNMVDNGLFQCMGMCRSRGPSTLPHR